MTSSHTAIERFCAYLQRRHYSAPTLESYRLDLRLFPGKGTGYPVPSPQIRT